MDRTNVTQTKEMDERRKGCRHTIEEKKLIAIAITIKRIGSLNEAQMPL